MSKQLNVNLGFTADTSQAAAQIQNLQNQLTGLLNSTNGSINFGSKVVGDVNKASKAIAELKMHLKNATNVNTGTLDFTKLNESISKGGMTLQQYGDKLRSLGPAGQQAFNALANSVAQSEIPIRRSNAALTEMWTTLKNTARWQISSSILHGFMGSISAAVGYAKDLNKSLNDIRIVTGASVDEMARFAEQANRSAKALSASTTEYTKASLIYYQQGLDDQAVKERTDVTIKMANVSGQTAEAVSDQMTAVWNNFAKGGEDLERFADVMVRLGADTASSSDEIAQGLEKFAAIGDMVGLSFDNAAAALATVTATTRQSADVVGTAFKTIFARIQGLKLGETLEDGTDLNKYSEALSTVGISIKDQNGELKDMDIILAEMGAKWKTLSKDQQVALAQTVAGLRQYNQLVALMENFDFYEQNLQSAENAEGSLQEQADIYAESWQAASDRVKAATQGIYEDLLNDEAFIDVLNIIEKILTYVDNLIDGLGGLGGVLTTVGALLTRAFSAQIAQGITSMTNGIKMMTAAGREQAQQQKAQFMKDSADAMRGMSDGSNEGNMRATMMEDQLRLQTSMIENSERMSAEEQQINQMLLDRQRILSDNAIAAAKELDATQERRSDANFNARVELAQEARGWAGGDLEVQKKNLSDFTKQFNKIQTKLKQGITARVNLEDLRKLPVEGEKGKQVIDKIKQAVDKIDDAEIKEIVSSLDTMELNAENVEDAIAALTIRLREMQSTSEASMMDENNEWMLSEDAVHGLSAAYEDEAAAALRARYAEEQANEARDNAANSINNATGAQQTWADQMVAGANVVMSLMSALQAVSGIIDVATNPDMSGWEKFLSIGSSLAMMFVMLAPLLQGTNLQFLATAAASIGAAVGMKAESVAALEASAATGTLSASLWTLLWPIGLVMAAIAALIGIFALFNSIAKANAAASLEGQLKATEEASKNLATSLSEVNDEADKLQSVFDGYTSVVETLRKCQKGTDEWKKALADVNQYVMDLLDKYPQLASYIDSSGQAGIYRDEKTGALAVNENFFVDKGQQLESGIENISMAKIVTDQRKADLTAQQAQEDLLLQLNSLFSGNFTQEMSQRMFDAYSGQSNESLEQALRSIELQIQGRYLQTVDSKTASDKEIYNALIQEKGYSKEYIDNILNNATTNFVDLFEDSSTGLSDAFLNLAKQTNVAAASIETSATAVGNMSLGNNQYVQNSDYVDQIIERSGKQYTRFYEEAIEELNNEAGGAGWGKEGVSKGIVVNATAEKYFEDYIKAIGRDVEQYELLDTFGTDGARQFKFKLKGQKDEEAVTKGYQEMLDVVAGERVKQKIESFGVGLTSAVEGLDYLIESTENLKQEDRSTMEATKDFLLDENFTNTSLLELNDLNKKFGTNDSDINSYLNQMFGGDDGILDDSEAKTLGHESANAMIEAFKSSLKEVDLSNFSKTIQNIVDKGADVSASIAQRYSDMVDFNSTFGTVEGSTELGPNTSPYVGTQAQGERARFDYAVQSGLSEDPAKANEELTRMVELLEQAPAGFQNLSEAADKIESSSVAAFNEELQEAIETFKDYEELNFTDIADGIIDEDEAEDLDVNTKSLKKYVEMLKTTKEGSGKTEAELMELAEASLKTAKAFNTLKEEWKDYKKNLQSGDIAKQADAIAKVGDAFKGVFGFDLSELDISDTFLTDPSNIQLVEDAINGVDGALESLQGKLFNQIVINAIGEENVKAITDELIAKGLMLEGQDFTAAFTADPTGFITALTQCENASKISAAAVQAAVSSMGYSMTYETETAETTQTASTDGGYSWQTVPGTPFEYEYVKNSEPGEEPVKDSITITPVGLKKVPNDPVEVSTTTLAGGSATNYEFGDGTKTDNNISMADIKNVKITKKSDTPTSKSVNSANPLIGSGNKPAGSGSKPKTGGSGKSPKEDKPEKQVRKEKAKLKTEDDKQKAEDEIERYYKINNEIEDLNRELDQLSSLKDEAWGSDKIKAMDKEIAKLKQVKNATKQYAKEIEQNLAKDEEKAKGFGAIMDENGIISNYEELINTWTDELNAVTVDQYNSYEQQIVGLKNQEKMIDDEADADGSARNALQDQIESLEEERDKKVKEAEDLYDQRKKSIEQYEETRDLLADTNAEIEDQIREIMALNFEKLQYKLEIRVELNESDLADIEFRLEQLGENNVYNAAERIAEIGKQAIIQRKLAEDQMNTMQEAERLYQLYLSGDKENGISQENYMKMIKESKEKIQEAELAIRQGIQDVKEELISAFDVADERFDKHFAKYDELTELVEHYKTITTLTKGEAAFGVLDTILTTSQTILKNRIEDDKKEIATWKAAREEQEAYVNSLSKDDPRYQAAKDALDDVMEKEAEANSQLMADIEQLGELAREVFENAIEKATQDFEEAMFGRSLSSVIESMEMMRSKQEELLTTTNKLYETNKMLRSIEKDIEATTNNRAKQAYNEFAAKVKQKQEQNQLSKFELELLTAEYEITKAQIALEEAQNAKEQVRLTRDSEGNYGYVYTANQDKIADAQQKLADAENNYYNTALEGAQRYQEQMYQHIEEWQTKIKEVYLDQTLSEEEKNRRIKEIDETYNTLILQDQELFYVAKDALIESSYENQAYYSDLNIRDAEKWFYTRDGYLQDLQAAQVEYDKNTAEVRKHTVDNFGSMAGAMQTTVEKSGSLNGTMNILASDMRTNLIKAIGDATTAWSLYADQLREVIKLQEQATKNSHDTMLKEAYKENYAAQIQQLAKSGVGYSNYDMQRLLEYRWEKMGGIDETDYQALINAGGTEEEIALWEILRKFKIEQTDWSASDVSYADEMRGIKLDQDYADLIIGYLSSSPYGRWSDSQVQKYLRERQIKIDDQKLSKSEYIMTNSELKEYIAKQIGKKPEELFTGGYTGEWGPEGKLAMLHEKELVLNKDDTKNFLTATNILREISQMLDNNALVASLGMINLNAMTIGTPADQVLQQEVTIHADFPNVTDHNEIEIAIDNLINAASQYAYKS